MWGSVYSIQQYLAVCGVVVVIVTRNTVETGSSYPVKLPIGVFEVARRNLNEAGTVHHRLQGKSSVKSAGLLFIRDQSRTYEADVSF